MNWIHLKQCKSTQDEVKKTLAELNLDVDVNARGFGIYTFEQSEGHGRGGRSWTSPIGNLAVSFVFHREIQNPTLLPLLVGLATRDAILQELPELSERLILKWPNDLLLDQKKVAGILVDKDSNRFIVGIGLNCTSAPEITDGSAVCLPKNKINALPEIFLDRLCDKLLIRINQSQNADLKTLTELFPKVGDKILVLNTDTNQKITKRESTVLDYSSAGALLVRYNDDGSTGQLFNETIRFI